MSCLPELWILSLDRALRENQLASSRNDPEIGIGSRSTLKLLVVSILPDRSFPPFSRSVMQWPQSYAPASGAPWRVAFLRPATSDRNLPTDPCRPAWPHS